MRSQLALAVLLALLFSLSTKAQVAPSAKFYSLPLDIGGGLSDFSLDYGPGRRMIGASAWLDYNLFHGLGLAIKGTSILADKPAVLQRMRQDSIAIGGVYRPRPIHRIRPEFKYLEGIGSIDFPSGDPTYTHDTYTVALAEGGAEYRIVNNLWAHGDYEYQWWFKYHGPNALNPNGFTIGATYYLRGIHRYN